MIPKSLIRSLYDIQHLRIQTGNRIVAEIKARMGQLPGQKEETIDDAEAKQRPWRRSLRRWCNSIRCGRRFVPGKFADRWMSQCGHKYTLPDGEKE